MKKRLRRTKIKKNNWGWAGPSSAQIWSSRFGLVYWVLWIRVGINWVNRLCSSHHQNLTCNRWDNAKNIIDSHGISGRLAGCKLQGDVCILSLAMNILGGWGTSNFKSDIFKHVSSSNLFPYNISEPKWKQINKGHQVSIH